MVLMQPQVSGLVRRANLRGWGPPLGMGRDHGELSCVIGSLGTQPLCHPILSPVPSYWGPALPECGHPSVPGAVQGSCPVPICGCAGEFQVK